jgi:hypothetical protein
MTWRMALFDQSDVGAVYNRAQSFNSQSRGHRPRLQSRGRKVLWGRVSLLFMFGLHPLEIVIALSLIALLLAVSLRK